MRFMGRSLRKGIMLSGPKMSMPALQNAETEVKTESHRPFRKPCRGMRTKPYKAAPAPSAMSVPFRALFMKRKMPDRLSML